MEQTQQQQTATAIAEAQEFIKVCREKALAELKALKAKAGDRPLPKN